MNELQIWQLLADKRRVKKLEILLRRCVLELKQINGGDDENSFAIKPHLRLIRDCEEALKPEEAPPPYKGKKRP